MKNRPSKMFRKYLLAHSTHTPNTVIGIVKLCMFPSLANNSTAECSPIVAQVVVLGFLANNGARMALGHRVELGPSGN